MSSTPQNSPPSDIKKISIGHCVYFSRLLDAPAVSAYADLTLVNSPPSSEHVQELLLSSHLEALAALLLGPNARVAKAQLEYIRPVKVGEKVTFSARITELDTARGSTKVNCLATTKHHVCMRGSALLKVVQ
jgi:Thioesterase superfamily